MSRRSRGEEAAAGESEEKRELHQWALQLSSGLRVQQCG